MTPIFYRRLLPGGFGADFWTFFTYAFIHADLFHFGVNLAWLLPFGTALARRFGTWRYITFMLVVAGGRRVRTLVTHPAAMVPMIGASAAISGAMAAALRFVFQAGGPLGLWRGEPDEAMLIACRPRRSKRLLRDPRFSVFLVVWIGLNALFGLGTVRLPRRGPGDRLAGPYRRFSRRALLFNAFDPVRRGERSIRAWAVAPGKIVRTFTLRPPYS